MTVRGEDVVTLGHGEEKGHKQMPRLVKGQTCGRVNAYPGVLQRRARHGAGCGPSSCTLRQGRARLHGGLSNPVLSDTLQKDTQEASRADLAGWGLGRKRRL